MSKKNSDSVDHTSFRIAKEVKPKSLAVLFSLIFGVLAVYFVNKNPELSLIFLTVFVLNFVTFIFLPKQYQVIAMTWGKLGIFLHYVVQPIFVSALFVLVFLPVGLLLRGFGGNPLWLKNRGLNSMWQKPSPSKSFKDQF